MFEKTPARGPVLQVERGLALGTSARELWSDELRDLLRDRLQIVSWIGIIPTVATLVFIHFGMGPRLDLESIDYVSYYVVLAVFLVPLIIVAIGNWSLFQLRVIEIGMFGLAAAVLATLDYRFYHSGWLPSLPPEDQQKLLLLAGDSMSLPWFMLLVLYGAAIPNTASRCAIVVAALSFLAFGLVVTLAAEDLANSKLLFTHVLYKLSFWLAIGAAIAIYGSHKLDALQRQAFAGRKLGQYRLKQRLGAGGMGEVHLAEHSLLRRPCAIKLIRLEKAGDAASLERFEREVQAMANLNHPNAVDIHDYGRASDGAFYYAMEYLPGLNLEQMTDKFGPLPPERVVHLLRQVCGVLGEAHQNGLIHRDIKPSNIIVCERGGVFDFVKLLDFGLVQIVDFGVGADRLTTEGTIVGTPLFMSPEQAEGAAHLDVRTDIYSLGAVAYNLLTAQPVFGRETTMRILAAHINERPAPLSDLLPGMPADLESVVLRCLEKLPEKRFANVLALEQALANCKCAPLWTRERAADWWRTFGAKAAQRKSGDEKVSTVQM